uniref:MHC class I antigen 8 n=1 Tax=Sus scrofa TaxID=9823 RepID=A0A287AM07_PIG
MESQMLLLVLLGALTETWAGFSVSGAPRPLSTPGLLTPHPGLRAERREGSQPLPAPRLSLHEVFPHGRVPARPRGAPVP